MNVNDFTRKTTIGEADAAVLVDQDNNNGYIMDMDVLAEKVLDRLTIARVNSKTEWTTGTLTAANNVVLDVAFCAKSGYNAYIIATGHTTADVSNGKLFDFNGISPVQTTVFPIAVGARWAITGTGYGFLGASYVNGTVASGQYFHIVLSFPTYM